MARHSLSRPSTWKGQGPRLLMLGALVLALPGCVHTDGWFHQARKQPLPDQNVSQIAMQWHGLAVAQDSANGGRPLPGIAGRMFLFSADPNCPPVLAEGKAVVDLLLPDEQGHHKLLERWEIDSKTLQRLARKDTIGHGYTLFLPWSTYNQAISQAQIRVNFFPTTGHPVFGTPTLVKIRPATTIPIEERVEKTRLVEPSAPK